jgi:glycosyltransferase involved in cell wall biosynthesis
LIGGAESLVSQWAGYLQDAGHEVAVCTIYTTGPFARPLAERRIPVHDLAHDPGIANYRLKRKYDLRLVRALDHLLRQGRYDVVHAHLFPALLHVALLSLLRRDQPYIYSEHSVNNRRRRYRAARMLDRSLYSRFARIVAVSEEVRRQLCQWLPALSNRVQVVPNSVDARRFRVPRQQVQVLRQELGIGPEQKVLLYAGRLIPEKGPDLLLQALSGPQASLNGAAPRLLLAGEGPLLPALQEQAAKVRAEVTFLGNRDDMPQLFNLADLVVLPSRWEGLPMTLLEAMAAGAPVLATSVGGIPEVVQHGVNGWLVPPQDTAALGNAIGHLLHSASLRCQLGEKGMETVSESYSPGATLGRLLQIYQEAI